MAVQLKISADQYRDMIAKNPDKKRLMLSDLPFIEPEKKKKESKYHAKKVEADGEIFDSKWEYERYLLLKAKERDGEISLLTHHPSPFVLQEGFTSGKQKIRPITYCPDFLYHENGNQIAEDTKGMITEVSRIKMKMFRKTYPLIELRIIKKQISARGQAKRLREKARFND